MHNEPLIRKAYGIQQAIFMASPEIKDTIKTIQKTGENRGYIFNFLGRKYTITDRRFAYKLPNHLIQGTSADILKIALNRLFDYLKTKKSRMVLNIHDEVIFEISEGEEDIIETLGEIMVSAHEPKLLPLEVDYEYSLKNLADKQDWDHSKYMNGKAERNSIQGKILKEASPPF
jgi:DNA polymerase-1